MTTHPTRSQASAGPIWSGRRAGAQRRPSPTLVPGAAMVATVLLAALLSFVWTPHDPTLMHPGDRLLGPNAEYWFGTDKFGRDTFSQVLVGARTTVVVGLTAVSVSALIGVPGGLLAAMAPKAWGRTIARITDVALAFPALLLAIMLAAVYGGSTLTAMIAIGLAGIPTFVRVVRASALQVLNQEYVLAARVAGRGPWSTAWTHVWPGVRGMVIVQCSVAFVLAVLAEAALSFLGLGTPPPTPSWGRMLQEAQEMLFVDARLAFIPGCAIAFCVLGFNLLGDGLRDTFDRRMRGSR